MLFLSCYNRLQLSPITEHRRSQRRQRDHASPNV